MGPRADVAAPHRGRGFVGTLEGAEYRPQIGQPFIVAAADRDTFDRVRPLVAQHA